MKNFVSALALIACCFALSNCGGGGSTGDTSPPTVRPKSMDGIRLTLDGNVNFAFIRNFASPAALRDGDVETGTFLYSWSGPQLRTYQNTSGSRSNTLYPSTISSARYSYRALNSASGTLTLTGLGTVGSFVFTSGTVFNGSYIPLFIDGISPTNPVNNNTVVMDLTFTSNGTYVSTNQAAINIPGSDPLYSPILIPTIITLTSSGYVPLNYYPIFGPNDPSKISPKSLNGKFFTFTSGTNDPTKNFTIQFTSSAQGLPMGNIGEVGFGLLRINGAAQDGTVPYTYTTTLGTDNAVLGLSGSGSFVDGNTTLMFTGTDNGTYVGTTSAASGSFTVTSP
jgi:hypothetical protein